MDESSTPRPGPGRVLALGLVVLSPLLAESLAGYDTTTGDPLALLGGLLFLGPLYGCPALLVREAARRFGVGWPGIVAACAAFGVVQAGVVDQSLFSRSYREIPYWDDLVLPTWIEPPGLAAFTAMSFVAGHVIWSFGAPIALVEALAGPRARTPWLRGPGLLAAALLYVAAAALILADHLRSENDHASAAQVGGSLTVAAALLAGAVALRRRPATPPVEAPSRPATPPGGSPSPRVVVVGLLSLVVALGFDLLPSTWPGFAGGLALLGLGAGALLRASRAAGWGPRHVVAVAGGAVLARAVTGFLVTPLGDVPPAQKYAHNVVFLLGALALAAWAVRRTRADAVERPRPPTAGRGRR